MKAGGAGLVYRKGSNRKRGGRKVLPKTTIEPMGKAW